MVKDILTRKSDGSYGFTEHGQITSYGYTVQKLLAHYMQHAMKASAADIQKKMAQLPAFLQQNFHSVDEYLDKLPLLAEFAGETNAQRFSAFIGQHFMGMHEKIEQQLMARELPKAKEKHENPYRAPGNDVLDAFGDQFKSAAGLVWPPTGEPPAGAAAEAGSAAAAVVAAPKDDRMPGEIALSQLGAAFQGAQGLQAEAGATAQPPTSAADPGSAAAVLAVPSGPQPAPGETILNRFASLFAAAPPLNLNGDGEGGEGAATPRSTMPVQVSFREYAQMVGAVSKFTRAKDNAGYKAWYSKLNAKQKGALALNSAVGREQQGAQVAWHDELTKISNHLALGSETTQKLKEEVKSYRTVLSQLQRGLQTAAKQSTDPPSVQKLYGQLVTLFENKDDIHTKKNALKMLLLQVADANAKGALQQEMDQLLDKLGTLYQLD